MRTLIENGTLLDPANRVQGKLNLVLEDGKVADVTTHSPPCDRVIDAAGHCVTPGFVDLHMHEDPYDPGADRIEPSIMHAMLRMGVTTALGGNCGINAVSPAKYLDLMDRDGGPVNMALLAGHTYLREQAGQRDKYAPMDDDGLKKLEVLVQQSLEAGCFGVSYGIRYVPGLDRRELLETAKYCKPRGKLIAAHVRDDAEHIFSAVEELFSVGRALEIPVQNSHVGSMGGFGQMERLLAAMDACRAAGMDLMADCYPYYAFSTRIGETTYDDGFLERYRADYSVIEICDGPYKGMRCTEEIFRQLRRQAPRTITVCHVMKPEDVDLALLHPGVIVASDGLMDHGQGHPRAAGTFPRFLANYARTGRIGLYHAVEKITALPARRLGLAHKGALHKGADADVVIFNPDTLADRATFDAPFTPPEGIKAVLVGGETALLDGQIINDSLGRAVRAK